MFVNFRYWCGFATMGFLVLALTGCRTPGVPTHCLNEPTIFDAPRSNQEPINFIRLRQDPPEMHLLDSRDVLGIFIEGVLGNPEESPPVHYPEIEDLPPAVGYPIPVRDDGTISLPLVGPLNVEGLTIVQAERLIQKAYTVDRLIIPMDNRIMVTLMRPRTYNVLVIREDRSSSGTAQINGEYIMSNSKRGSAYSLELPAYKNDVLHALTESGGLPGVDAKNEVTILRGEFDEATSPGQYLQMLKNDKTPSANRIMAKHGPLPEVRQDTQNAPMPSGEVLPVAYEEKVRIAQRVLPRSPADSAAASAKSAPLPTSLPTPLPASQSNVVKIPLRARPNEPLMALSQEDIILNDGDIVFIQSRDAEVFYTGGLIPGGQHEIPRDYDLDVLGAIGLAGGSIATAPGAGGTAGLNRSGSGVGYIFPPTRVVIMRIKNGRQVTMHMSLKDIRQDSAYQDRILVQPNDVIMLQYTPRELITNILVGNLQFNYFLNRY